jgi:hypothetical protein
METETQVSKHEFEVQRVENSAATYRQIEETLVGQSDTIAEQAEVQVTTR